LFGDDVVLEEDSVDAANNAVDSVFPDLAAIRL
jgi:hypothetical protein